MMPHITYLSVMQTKVMKNEKLDSGRGCLATKAVLPHGRRNMREWLGHASSGPTRH